MSADTPRAVRRLSTLLRTINCSAPNTGIIQSNYPDVEIPTDISLSQYVMQHFAQYGNLVAVVDAISNKSYTYRQLSDLIHRCGSGLVKAGFKHGDVCALYKPNMIEYIFSFHSVISIGGIATTVNPAYTADELMHQLQNSEAKWIITIPELVGKAKKAAEQVSSIKGIFTIGEERLEGCIPFSDLMKDDGSAFPTNVKVNQKEDVVILPYSSGTTGLPKGVMLTHHNMIANCQQATTPGLMDMKADHDVYICVLPFFHIYGIFSFLICALMQGAKLIIISKFEPEMFLQTIEKHKVTHAFVVPPIILFMIKHPIVDKYNLSSLEIVGSGAAPLGGEHVDALKKKLNNDKLIVLQGYGLTETSPITNVCNRFEEHPLGSVGQLVPNSQAKVVDVETGKTLGVGEDGELCYRGPHIMKGYLKNEEATRRTIIDGWLHTGDIGHYDSAGHFFVVDRLKELIKFKGFQVAPAELEALLLTHPEIQDAAVIGIPDENAGELPKAFIVPKTNTLTTSTVADFVEARVAPHKRLRGGVEFIEEIPKSASGKILRRLLKAHEVERIKQS